MTLTVCPTFEFRQELPGFHRAVWFAGLCMADIDSFCGAVKPGERRIAECLSKQKAEEEKGNVDGTDPNTSIEAGI